ncbi:TonB-dependent receptor plug domain-containing protein [Pseudoalteromonas ardens]|uniref:TonB-dependent receptor n=1 Tax=Pseudoalteromonas rubra TaxID=43658 RepID=A0A0L0EWT3_9GAMM|nr:TonB-dependent receptor [Pseudoalteromonas sp. R96]KNC68900.1 TonB-dependent receptor [Pseudoalteromonas rubra]MDK1310218.1 TonB-dependent receptor [Pseudoalteromonas sp. R96]
MSLLLSTLTVIASAASAPATGVDKSVEKIEVQGVRSRLIKSGALKDDIAKTELLSNEYIKNTQSSSLADAIQNAIGIRVSNECAMCGAKRIMINGLKGEHTNVLVDGIPMHTMISGFYGMDSVAASGIGRIEIARGAGASLTAPEAIGGTVNLVTAEPSEDKIELDMATGTGGYKLISALANGISADGNTRATLIGQYDNKDQFDGDGNGVSENPALTNQSLTLMVSHDIGYSDNIRVRLNQTQSEVFGGPVLGDTATSISATLASVSQGEADALFVNDDVRNRYIGNAWETAEWVKTEREEASLSWLHEISSRLNVTSSLAYVDHIQDSFYESTDYYAEDTMYYYSVRFNYDLNAEHLLTFGADKRDEKMRSSSAALESTANYVSDSFDYDTTGLYIQDTWLPNESVEVSAALRLDQIQADFVDPQKPGIEIDKTILSPRVDMRYFHNDSFTSRLSLGQGYRAPLSFFESDHGILDSGKGFQVEVSEPERSKSATYSLSYETEMLTVTASAAHTKVEHLATLSHTDSGTPVLTQLAETAAVTAVDISANWQVSDTLTVSAIAEQYHYDDTFKASFGIAPIEKRATLSTDLHINEWEIITSAIWVASRDLTEYGYEGFNDANGEFAKPTTAESYVTVDLKVVKPLSKALSLYAGASNLFDYNQAEDMGSPLMYDAEGGYDVVYIHGPLRGRQAYLGLTYEF